MKFIWSSQTFTVSRTADKWFVSFVLDAEKIPPIIHPVHQIGVDLGVKCLATCSDGSVFEMPVTASNNAIKYYKKLSKQQAHLAKIRNDTVQKMTTDLSRKAYLIRIEDLNVAGLIANHKLAAAISNNCFSEIRRQLIYKQPHYGTKVELVERWFPSSKTCSNCGNVQPMPLKERIFDCTACGYTQDRDLNAAKNLQNVSNDRVRLA